MKIINGTVYSKGNPTLNFGYYDPRTKAPYISVQGASQYLISHLSSIPIGFTICVNEDNKPVEYWWDGIAFVLKVNGVTSEELQQAINDIPQPESISIKNFTVYYQGNNPPLASTIEATYSFSTDILVITTNEITQNKPNGTNVYYYKGTILSNSNSIIWEGPFREITDQELVAQMSVSSTYPLQIYKVASTQPETPTGITFTYSNGIVTYTQLNGWSETIPQTTGGKVYVSYNNLILIQNTPQDTPAYNGNCTGWTTPVEYINLDVILGDVISYNEQQYQAQRQQAISDLESWISGLGNRITNANNTLHDIEVLQQQIDNGTLDVSGINSSINDLSRTLATTGWAQYYEYYLKIKDSSPDAYIKYSNNAYDVSPDTDLVIYEATQLINGQYYVRRAYVGNTDLNISSIFDAEFTFTDNNINQTVIFERVDDNASGSFLYSKQVQDALNGQFITTTALSGYNSFEEAVQTIAYNKIESAVTSITQDNIKSAVLNIASDAITSTVGELTADQQVNLSKILQNPNGITLSAMGGSYTLNWTNAKFYIIRNLNSQITFSAQVEQDNFYNTLKNDSNISLLNTQFRVVPYVHNNKLQYGQFVYREYVDGSPTDYYLSYDNHNFAKYYNNGDGYMIVVKTSYSVNSSSSVQSSLINLMKNNIRLSVTDGSNGASFELGLTDANGNSYANIDAQVINITGQVLANAIAAKDLNIKNVTYLKGDGSASFGKASTYFDELGNGYTAGGKISWGNSRLIIYSSNAKTNPVLTIQTTVNNGVVSSTTKTLDINGTSKTYTLSKDGNGFYLYREDSGTTYYAYYTSNKWNEDTSASNKYLFCTYYAGTTLSVEGLITATGGQIGGWTIANNALVTTYGNYNFTIYPGDTNSMGYMRVTNNNTSQWQLNADGTASFSQGAITFGTNTWAIGTPNNANAQISYSNGQITIGSNVVIAGGVTANKINISKVVNNNTISDYAGIEGPTANNNKVIWSGDTRSGNPSFYVTDEGEIFGSKGTLSVINNNHITDLHEESFNPSSGVYSNFDGFTRYIMNNNSDAQSAVNKLTNFNQNKQVYTLDPATFYNEKVYIFNPSKVGDVVYLPQGGNTSEYVIVLPFGYAGDGGPSDSYYCSIPYEDLVQCVGRRITLINLDDSYNIIFVSPNNYVHRSQIVTSPDRQLVSTIGTSLITSNPQLTQSDVEIQHDVTYEYTKASNQSGTSGFFYIEIKYSEYNGLPYIYTELTSSNNPTMVNPTSNQIAVMQ